MQEFVSTPFSSANDLALLMSLEASATKVLFEDVKIARMFFRAIEAQPKMP